MTIPEESIEGALIIGEHGVARAGTVRSIRDVEAALAVVLDRGYQVHLLPQGSVPYDTARASWHAL
jgi:Mg-chelatase subunit ChlI